MSLTTNALDIAIRRLERARLASAQGGPDWLHFCEEWNRLCGVVERLHARRVRQWARKSAAR